MQAIDTIEVGGSLESADGVPLDKVESELASRLQIAQLDAREPVRRVRMSNLIIVCHQTDTACAAEAQVPEIVGYHPRASDFTRDRARGDRGRPACLGPGPQGSR